MIDSSSQAQPRFASPGELLAATERVALATFPSLFALWAVIHWMPGTSEGVDFRQFYAAAWHLLHGGDIYRTLGPLGQNHAFVYPPLSAVIFAPSTILGLHAASVIWGAICLTLVPATLWVMNVRDWRIYTVTLAWAPVFVAWQTGNETSVLLLLLALLWRHRDRPAAAGVLTALSISMKLFMWPLALWLIATRRWRATGWSLIAGICFNTVSWALAGFDNIGRFLHQSGLDVQEYWRLGYSIAGTLAPFGVAHNTGSRLTLLASAALGLTVLYVGYVQRHQERALTLTVALILIASPIVWNHYYLLLLVPLAISRPRLTWLWMVPILVWACPCDPVLTWQRPLAWALAATIVVALLRRPGAGESRTLPRVTLTNAHRGTTAEASGSR